MHDPIPTGPTPTAVPWTPDMMTPQMAPPAPVAAPIPAPLQTVAAVHPQYQPVAAPAPQHHAPQPAYVQPANVAQSVQQQPHPQVAQPAAPQQAFAPQQQMVSPQAPAPQMQQPRMASPQMAQPQMHAAPHAPAVQPAHRVPAPQMAQAQYAPTPAAPQFQHPAPPPPLAPHMRVPQQVAQQIPAEALAAPGESQSFIAKLLKRSPRPELTEANVQMPPKSGSLFNKNFAIGAVAGLVVGAFVLPMVLGLFGGDASVQTQAQAQAGPLPGFDINSPAASEGDGFKPDTFIDNAMATEAP